MKRFGMLIFHEKRKVKTKRYFETFKIIFKKRVLPKDETNLNNIFDSDFIFFPEPSSIS